MCKIFGDFGENWYDDAVADLFIGLAVVFSDFIGLWKSHDFQAFFFGKFSHGVHDDWNIITTCAHFGGKAGADAGFSKECSGWTDIIGEEHVAVL